MDDKEGKWVTINGTHIFLKKGQSVEQAFAEMGIKQDKAVDDIVNSVSYVQMSSHIHYYYDDDFKHRVPPKKHAQRVFRNAVESRANDEDNELVINTLKNKVNEFILKDSYGSDLKWTAIWDKGKIIRLHLSINGTRTTICNVFYHEMGHAIDMYKWGKYSSSDYVSTKYGVSMADMLFNELQDAGVDYLRDEYELMKSKKQKL